NVGAPVFVVVGTRLGCKSGDVQHVLLSLLEGNAGLQARNGSKKSAAPPFLGAGDRQRSPYLGSRLGEGEALRHDADDRGRQAVDLHFLANDAAIPAELMLPELVSEDDDAIVPGKTIVGNERAT